MIFFKIIALARPTASGDPRITKFFSIASAGADLSTSQCAPVRELIFFIVSPPFPMTRPHLSAEMVTYSVCSAPYSFPPPKDLEQKIIIVMVEFKKLIFS